MSLTLGHDSEFGLEQDGQILSALDYLVKGEVESGSWFPDNLNAEIAITPVQTLSEFHNKTEILLDSVRSQGFDLVMKPVITYSDDALKNRGAFKSGCEPDYNAYSEQINQAPNFRMLDSAIRSCGAHIHVGAENLDVNNWARWMDVLVALPLLEVEEKSVRRDLYGQGGAVRYKDYGGEYRTLSNVWLDSRAYREFVWEGTHKAVELSRRMNTMDIPDWQHVPMSIADHDLSLAKQTIDRIYLLTGVSNVL